MDLDISIYVLKYFVKVAELGNITNAAEELYITQPTLSRQVANLEALLQIPLFRRVKSGVELTEAGRKFYDNAKKLIAAYDEFMAHVYDARGLVAGTLFTAHHNSCQELVISFNKRFLREYQNVNIRSREQGETNLLDGVKGGDYHAVFIYQNEIGKRHKQLSHLHLGNMRNMLLVSTESEFADRESISLGELKEQKFVLPSRLSSPHRYEEIILGCEEEGFSPEIVSTADSLLGIVTEVVRYNAVTILPYTHNLGAGGQVRYIELEDFPKAYPLALVWRTDTDNPVLRAYVEFIRGLTRENERDYFYTPQDERYLL